MNVLNIPAGSHEAVLRNDDDAEMIETWSELIVDIDERTMRVFGLEAGRKTTELVPIIAYAHIAKAAFNLAHVADIASKDFDAAVFGARCAMIAREQISRHRLNIDRLQFQQPDLRLGAVR